MCSVYPVGTFFSSINYSITLYMYNLINQYTNCAMGSYNTASIAMKNDADALIDESFRVSCIALGTWKCDAMLTGDVSFEWQTLSTWERTR